MDHRCYRRERALVTEKVKREREKVVHRRSHKENNSLNPVMGK